MDDKTLFTSTGRQRNSRPSKAARAAGDPYGSAPTIGELVDRQPVAHVEYITGSGKHAIETYSVDGIEASVMEAFRRLDQARADSKRPGQIPASVVITDAAGDRARAIPKGSSFELVPA